MYPCLKQLTILPHSLSCLSFALHIFESFIGIGCALEIEQKQSKEECMEQNKKGQKFNQNQNPGKKTEMPERKREDISSGPRTTTRPEIDLPLKGGRSDADLSQKNQTKKDDARRGDRNDYEKSSR